MSPNLYRVISFDRQVNTGVTDTYQVTVSAVAKCNSPECPYYLPNEYACSELGRFLRLPIPPCALLFAPGEDATQWFASLDFNFLGSSLPPVEPQYVVEHLLDLASGLLIYDILIANCDRHAGNLSVDALTHPRRLFIFDQSHALFGPLANSAEQRFTELRDRLAVSAGSRTGGSPHCLLNLIPADTYFRKWIDRVREIPDYLIEELCQDCAELGATAAESVAAAAFLKHRRDHMNDMIRNHQAAFSAILQWSLWT